MSWRLAEAFQQLQKSFFNPFIPGLDPINILQVLALLLKKFVTQTLPVFFFPQNFLGHLH
jgi:hypothetical protein